VSRHLHKKIESGSHEFKEELILCLMELVRSENCEECRTDEEWTRMMDRGDYGRLKKLHFCFLVIEEETRQCLKTLSSSHPKCKQEIVMSITSDEDVLLYWIISTADLEVENKEIHNILLNMIVELYVTMRVLLCKYVDGKV